MKKKSEIALTIAEIGAKGDGTGQHNGKTVYVGKTAPGDTALVRLGTEREDGYNAKLLRIITPGPQRTDPPCPYFQECGGCALQHVTQTFYRNWKINKVKSALSRSGVICERWEEPVFLTPSTRRRTTLTAYKAGKEVRLGYNEARTHNILNIQACMVLEPELDAKVQALRPFLPALLPDKKPVDITLQHVEGTFDLVLTGAYQTGGRFSLAQDEAIGALAAKLDIARVSFREKDFQPPEILLSRKPVLKRFGALSVALPPGAFLQASATGEQALVSRVLSLAGDASKIADLFCGCGTFTGHFLARGAHVTSMDGDENAVAALTAAGKSHKNLVIERRNLFRNPLNETQLSPFDAIIFDPPRAGAKAQAALLAQSKVPKIIAISCNPATFARDAKILQDGGYILRSLTLIDQFVWAAHAEVVGLFEKS